MTIESISATGSTYHATAKAAVKSLTDDGGEQFMQLLLAQLRNQNPLDPVQDKDFMSQLTQLNSFQELQKMTKLLQAQGKSGQLAEAAVLIGREITATTPDGQVQTGTVTGVTMNGEQAQLIFGKYQAALTDVLSVRAQEA